ncbi:MAG: peptide ABC transporter substrate-binding protein [Armatimonadetes bacterium]|nr:peptide ABC transporter substrate-binding protein [Armatimonadota bacterium]
MRFRFRLLPPALAAVLLTLGGCAHHSQDGSSGNTLRVPMLAAPTTFDPATVEDGTTIDMLQQVFEGLVQWTPDNKIAPALAEKWEVSPDGRTYTFHLRPGVKFQDGHPVGAQDVYYSLRRALDPGLNSSVTNYLEDIVGAKDVEKGTAELKGVKVVDPMTVAITISKPKAYWIYTLTYPTGYIVSQAEAQPNARLTDAEVAQGAGTGPFKLARYDKDARVILAANPDYWGGPPKIAGQERPVVIDAGTRHDLYVRGQLDIVDEQKDALDADLKDARLKDQVKFFPRAATYYIGLNQLKFPPFKDVRVRQALAYATDKKKIQDVVLRNRLDVAQDILPEGIPGYDPKFQGIPYDPTKAKALLAQAGYPGGKGFPTVPIFYRESYPDLDKTVDLLRQMWQQNLGINVEARRTEWGALLAQEHNNALECYHIRWAADYLDPQDYYSILLTTHGGENHTGYSNPKYDALCAQADVSQNPKARMALYRQAARIAADEVPMIPLYYQKDIELVSPAVHDLEDSLMGHLPYKKLTLAR